MLKKSFITISIVLQFFMAWFLLTFLIFGDSSANWIEFLSYLLLVFIPHIIVLFFYKKKNIAPSIVLGVGLYLITAIILSFLDNINDFYVTGMSGVDLSSSISVMAIHFTVLLGCLVLTNKTPEQIKELKRQLPIIFLCIIITLLFIVFPFTYARQIEPNSYLALGYLDIKDMVSELLSSIFLGFFYIYSQLNILSGFIIYIFIFIGIVYTTRKKFNYNLSFIKKLFLFFTPIWLYMAILATPNTNKIKNALHNNFKNFTFTWDTANKLQSYNVNINNTRFTIWCDEKVVSTKQSASCSDKLKVLQIDKTEMVVDDTFTQALDVGMFAKVNLYPDKKNSCITTKNTALIDNKKFLVTTKACDDRNFPIMAELKWEGSVRPILHCFATSTCHFIGRYY